MKKRIWLGLLILLTLAVPLAVAQQGAAEKAKESGASAAAKPSSSAKPATDDPSYVIGQDDVLDISVWKEPEVSRQVPVRPDGKISLPLLNDVQASGLTPMQLQSQLTEKLKKFLTEPQVTVIVTAINSRRVYLMGEINRPGAIPLVPNMTVLQALSSAGGVTQFANSSKIQILRTENGKQGTYLFNYKDVIRGVKTDQNILLKPGDSIVVP
ncbi:MAG: polysaccharide biosynthesis/export family protein [Burkholderiales bacterium]